MRLGSGRLLLKAVYTCVVQTRPLKFSIPHCSVVFVHFKYRYAVNSTDTTVQNTQTLLFRILINSKDTALLSDILYLIFYCNFVINIHTLKVSGMKVADPIEVYTRTVLHTDVS